MLFVATSWTFVYENSSATVYSSRYSKPYFSWIKVFQVAERFCTHDMRRWTYRFPVRISLEDLYICKND